MNLKFGTRLELNLADFEQLVSQTRVAEEGGFEAAWVRDHLHIPEHGGGHYNPECWTTLAALARATKTIGVGSLVTCVPFRSPTLLAKMGATVDVMSNGRCIMGIGAGGNVDEFKEYGFDMPPNKDRALMLREAVQILKGMWGPEHKFSFSGKYYTVDGAVNEPKPKRKGGPPIIIGAYGKEIAMRTVAKYGDGWSINFGGPRFAELHDALKQYCDEGKRDIASVEIHVGIHCLIAPTVEEAQRRKKASIDKGMGGHLGDRWFAGTVDGLLEYLKPWTARGVQHFITYFHEPGRHNDEIREFGELVIKPLTKAA